MRIAIYLILAAVYFKLVGFGLVGWAAFFLSFGAFMFSFDGEKAK